MSCSANRVSAGVVTAIGFAAFALPLSTPWYLVIVCTAGLALCYSAAPPFRLRNWLVAASVVMLILAAVVPPALAVAVLAASSLALLGRSRLSLSLLLLAMSIWNSAQAILAELFGSWWALEALGPAIVASLVLTLSCASWREVGIVSLGAIVSAGVASIGHQFALEPLAQLCLVAVPVVLAAGLIGGLSRPSTIRWHAPTNVMLLLAIGSWVMMPPRTVGDHWVLLPDSPDAHEAAFFRNYAEALAIAGLRVRRAAKPEDVPENALLIMPWLTASVGDDAQIGSLARQRRWTILAGGEHTNLGDVSARIERLVNHPVLRNDLTVPPGNSDQSGPLRSSSFNPWPHEAILNRGASVAIRSLIDRVILAGDGWWTEPDIGEWLWVGDYVWRPGDMAGRITLAAVVGDGGARWLVVSDNSVLLNQQIIANPQAIKQLVSAASLWPTFLHDLFLFTLGASIIVGVNPVLMPVALASISMIALMTEPRSGIWRDQFVGQSGFDERNFNQVLAEHPSIALSGKRFIRMRRPISGHATLPAGSSILFGLIDGSAEFDGIRIDQCRRLGSLSTNEGPVLMDAQACRITGDARILIGSTDAAAAIAIKVGKTETILILDTAFLSKVAPSTNVEWLKQVMSRN